MPPFKVLLTTSGTGSRLGELTRHTNKALIEIHGKPAISYIIERYAPEVELVITVGYLAEQVKEKVKQLYPERPISFVEVDCYEGSGSSLGYSMLSARELLQCPFVFHCCDTIVLDDIPAPTEDWIGGFELPDVAQYRTLELEGESVVWINDKGEGSSQYIHVGLVGVHDYRSFWEQLQKVYEADPADQALNDTFAINGMLKAGVSFRLLPLKTWYDTGNPQALARTEAELSAERA